MMSSKFVRMLAVPIGVYWIRDKVERPELDGYRSAAREVSAAVDTGPAH
jgi:hypothetical protein